MKEGMKKRLRQSVFRECITYGNDFEKDKIYKKLARTRENRIIKKQIREEINDD